MAITKMTKREFIQSNLLGLFGLWLAMSGFRPPRGRLKSMPGEDYFFVDIHNHPTLKPIGKSPLKLNSDNPDEKNSIWYNDRIGFLKKAENLSLGFAAYTQSDFTATVKGNLRVSGVSLYAPEVKFFENKIGKSIFGKEFQTFVSQFGEKRIQAIENRNYDYFTDLEEQYNFLVQNNGHVVTIDDQKYRYILVKNYQDILDALQNKECATLAVFTNIEGGHCFGPGKEPVLNPYPESKVLENVKKIKQWEFRPLYVTLAHHFYNELCGHTRSIPDELKKILDQSYGLNSGFTPTGRKVLNILLDNSNNDRILIDVKHFSLKCRSEYYKMLDTDYSTEQIPIVFSHGGVNGLESFDKSGTQIPHSLFNEWDISLFDDEIVRIAKSKGIIGLNFDKRIMSNDAYLKTIPKSLSRPNMLAHWSKLIWNNIRHIGEVCDKNNLPAWDIISLGTDNDGIINPIDGYWTFEEMPYFASDLLYHANEYLQNPRISSDNKISPEELVQKVMNTNAMMFLKRSLGKRTI